MYRTIRNLIAAAPIATLAVTMATGIAHADSPDPRPPELGMAYELDHSGLLGSESGGGLGDSSGTERGRYLGPRIPWPDFPLPSEDDESSGEESGSDEQPRLRIPGLPLSPDIPDFPGRRLPLPFEPDEGPCEGHVTDPGCDESTTSSPCDDTATDECDGPKPGPSSGEDPNPEPAGGDDTNPNPSGDDDTNPGPSEGDDTYPGPPDGGNGPDEFPVPELIDAGTAAGSADDGTLELVWLLTGGGVLTASGAALARRIQKARNN